MSNVVVVRERAVKAVKVQGIQGPPGQAGGGGGGAFTPVFKSGSYTALPGDLVVVDASSGAVPITLPDPTLQPGEEIIVTKDDASANLVVISGLINNGSVLNILKQYDAPRLTSDGVVWRLT